MNIDWTFLQWEREAKELYELATMQIYWLGIPGSPELWELRNYWSRVRMNLNQYLDDLYRMQEAVMDARKG